MSDINLEQVKARAVEAKVLEISVNPWQLVDEDRAGNNWFVATLGEDRDGICYYIETDHVKASEHTGSPKRDGEFIIKLRGLVPALAADVEALAIEVERLRKERDEWQRKALVVDYHPAIVALRRERDEARAEVLEVLVDEVAQGCYIEAIEGNGYYMDMGLSTYRSAIHRLVEAGRMRKIDDKHDWYEFVKVAEGAGV